MSAFQSFDLREQTADFPGLSSSLRDTAMHADQMLDIQRPNLSPILFEFQRNYLAFAESLVDPRDDDKMAKVPWLVENHIGVAASHVHLASQSGRPSVDTLSLVAPTLLLTEQLFRVSNGQLKFESDRILYDYSGVSQDSREYSKLAMAITKAGVVLTRTDREALAQHAFKLATVLAPRNTEIAKLIQRETEGDLGAKRKGIPRRRQRRRIR